MSFLREHGIQSVLAVLQATVVVAGSMCTATMLKALGYPESRETWSLLSVFVQNWGFAILIVPASWVLVTLWLEHHQQHWFSKRWTLVTGLMVCAALVLLFFASTVGPTSVLITVAPDPPLEGVHSTPSNR